LQISEQVFKIFGAYHAANINNKIKFASQKQKQVGSYQKLC
jgi:hypothetical protein